MAPIQVSRKSNEKEVYNFIRDEKEIQKPKFKLGQLDRTADLKRVISQSESTNWSYNI